MYGRAFSMPHRIGGRPPRDAIISSAPARCGDAHEWSALVPALFEYHAHAVRRTSIHFNCHLDPAAAGRGRKLYIHLIVRLQIRSGPRIQHRRLESSDANRDQVADRAEAQTTAVERQVHPISGSGRDGRRNVFLLRGIKPQGWLQASFPIGLDPFHKTGDGPLHFEYGGEQPGRFQVFITPPEVTAVPVRLLRNLVGYLPGLLHAAAKDDDAGALVPERQAPVVIGRRGFSCANVARARERGGELLGTTGIDKNGRVIGLNDVPYSRERRFDGVAQSPPYRHAQLVAPDVVVTELCQFFRSTLALAAERAIAVKSDRRGAVGIELLNAIRLLFVEIRCPRDVCDRILELGPGVKDRRAPVGQDLL